MKKIILIATLLFSGAIFAFADMNINVTFVNHTSEQLTIAQGGNYWFANNMPNTIAINPQSQSTIYCLEPQSSFWHHTNDYDGVQGFNIYNSLQSQYTHLEIAVNFLDNEQSLCTESFSSFGNVVSSNTNSFQGAYQNYSISGYTYAIGTAYSSNSSVPFAITNVINPNGNVVVNIYNPANILLFNGVTTVVFRTSNYGANLASNPSLPYASTHDSGILVLNKWYGTGTIVVDQNGVFTLWGGSGQWPYEAITNIPYYLFNSDGTLSSMTVDLEDGQVWTYANGKWSQQS